MENEEEVEDQNLEESANETEGGSYADEGEGKKWKRRCEFTNEEAEAIKILSITGRSDAELSDLYQVSVKQLVKWRHDDPVWTAAVKAARGNARARSQVSRYKGPKKLDKKKTAELVSQGAEMTTAQLSERNRHLVLQVANHGLERAIDLGHKLPIKSYNDVETLGNMAGKAGGWNAAPLQINVSAFSEMSPASVTTTIDLDEEETEREAYFRG